MNRTENRGWSQRSSCPSSSPIQRWGTPIVFRR